MPTFNQDPRQGGRRRSPDRKTLDAKDLQAFLASFFVGLSPKLARFIGDEYNYLNWWIVRTWNPTLEGYSYRVLGRSRYFQEKRQGAVEGKMRYTPSTGGRQKYKTTPRDI